MLLPWSLAQYVIVVPALVLEPVLVVALLLHPAMVPAMAAAMAAVIANMVTGGGRRTILTLLAGVDLEFVDGVAVLGGALAAVPADATCASWAPPVPATPPQYRRSLHHPHGSSLITSLC